MPTNKIQELFNVNGLVAVITGGGSGLGLYAARALDANGAKAVYIVGRREDTLKEAAKTGVNGTIKPIVGDVTNKESLKKVVEQVKQEQGFINLLFANSGIIGPSNSAPITKSEPPSVKEFADHCLQPGVEDFTQTFNVNVSGVLYTAMSFLELLDAGNKKRNVAQDSHIVVTSSVAAYSRYLNHGFAYSASKAAVSHLVKMMSTTFAQQGFHIRANVIAPGLYPSEMTQGTTSGLDKFAGIDGHEGAFSDAHKMDPKKSPAERTGSEEDFAGTILFMASRAGAYLNGNELLTDGGRVSVLPATY